jgi:Tfp pilus assembly protein PilN
MLVQQIPVPPAPPDIPFDPNLVITSMDGPAIVMIVLLVMTACTIVLWPLEGRGAVDPQLKGELEQMHHRLAEVDTLQMRVGELEERLDFAERLLARTDRDPAPLPRSST